MNNSRCCWVADKEVCVMLSSWPEPDNEVSCDVVCHQPEPLCYSSGCASARSDPGRIGCDILRVPSWTTSHPRSSDWHSSDKWAGSAWSSRPVPLRRPLQGWRPLPWQPLADLIIKRTKDRNRNTVLISCLSRAAVSLVTFRKGPCHDVSCKFNQQIIGTSRQLRDKRTNSLLWLIGGW